MFIEIEFIVMQSSVRSEMIGMRSPCCAPNGAQQLKHLRSINIRSLQDGKRSDSHP